MIVTLKYLQKEVSFSRQILNPLAVLLFKASKEKAKKRCKIGFQDFIYEQPTKEENKMYDHYIAVD